jgi:hypothetical protein
VHHDRALLIDRAKEPPAAYFGLTIVGVGLGLLGIVGAIAAYAWLWP